MDEEKIIEQISLLFKDVKPIDQPKDYEILHIDYDFFPEFVNSYFKAVLHLDEISERVFFLSQIMIEVSVSNYMAWYIRRKCIDNLDFDKNDELIWLNKMTVENPKNYQLWNHRKIITELISNYDNEIEIIDKVLEGDPKNYHAWCHRIWVTRFYRKFNDQFTFVAQMIKKDVMNNSAWNFRHFLVSYIDKDNQTFSNEISYCLEKINLNKNNESILAYLSGLNELNENKLYSDEKLINFCKSINYNEVEEPILLELLVEYSKSLNNKEEIKLIYHKLSTVDYIRKKYWLSLYDSLN